MVFPALSARRTGRGRVPPHPKLGPFPECVERTEVEIEQAWGVLVDRRGEGRVPLRGFAIVTWRVSPKVGLRSMPKVGLRAPLRRTPRPSFAARNYLKRRARSSQRRAPKPGAEKLNPGREAWVKVSR